jgi:hypothetical protein
MSFLNPTDPLFPYLFPVFGIAMWLAATGVIAQISGWSRLGDKYSTDKQFPDNTKGFQSATFGMTSYRSCIWLGCDQNGLYMKTGPLFFFCFRHPPLFIPWSALSEARPTKRLWVKFISLVVRDPDVTFAVPEGALKDCMRYLQDNNLLRSE